MLRIFWFDLTAALIVSLRRSPYLLSIGPFSLRSAVQVCTYARRGRIYNVRVSRVYVAKLKQTFKKDQFQSKAIVRLATCDCSTLNPEVRYANETPVKILRQFPIDLHYSRIEMLLPIRRRVKQSTSIKKNISLCMGTKSLVHQLV